MTAPKWFVLEICEEKTECVVQDVHFEVPNMKELSVLLNIADFVLHGAYDLEIDEILRIKEYLNLDFETKNIFVILRHQCASDDLPYQTHTYRELILMLAGSKPLAAFCGEYPPNINFEEIPVRLFDPFVEMGRFVKREYVEPLRNERILGMRWVLYSLPSEVWRIDAFILLKHTASKTGWNEGFERMEGSLLGYAEWQNDIFSERSKRNK